MHKAALLSQLDLFISVLTTIGDILLIVTHVQLCQVSGKIDNGAHPLNARVCIGSPDMCELGMDDDSTVWSILSGLETRSLGLNTFNRHNVVSSLVTISPSRLFMASWV